MPPKTGSDQPQVSKTTNTRPPTNTTQTAEGTTEPVTLEGPNQPIDINHAMLLEAIEDSGISPDFASMAARRGITKDAMRMRYARLRQRIYEATKV
ncbi:unnamed protein product [Penicillium salamii]|nr:unnamed protein product [Penicillium salamii]